MSANKIYIFKRFERLWHWAQAALIIILLHTGFEIHGSYTGFSWERAVDLHTTAAWSLVGLWVFAIFWHITTGEWTQYIPTMQKVDAMLKYYLVGIFTSAPHPFRASTVKKHNPLQRLAYLFIWLVIAPIIWISGWSYLFYSSWRDWGWDKYLSLEWVATFHVAAAFMFLVFMIAHVYLITAGHSPTAHLKAMITGWEDVGEQH